MRPHVVAVPVTDDVPIFELAIPCEVFGQARPELADPWYEFRVCAPSAGHTSIALGFTANTVHGLEALADADTVIVPACASVHDEQPADLVAAVRAAYDAGARLVSLCSGAFVLAAAGILDGRVAATHWMHAELLARRFPKVQVDANVLYLDDGDILTSAGTTAGLDLCLHIVRIDHGASVANAVAKRLVMPAHRQGGQAQYIDTTVNLGHTDNLAPLLDWARQRLDEQLTIDDLATQAKLSPRTLIRHFTAATGTTPMNWLREIRINHARQLLETTTLSVDQIARRSGLGNPANLRHHFTKTLGTAPSTYRRAFNETSPRQP